MRAALAALFGLTLRIFFRRIEIVGTERVPEQGGLVFVLNHPNALIDPSFMLCFAARPVSFLAKSTLFTMPVVGAITRGFDSLPVYRHSDQGQGADPKQNRDTFEQARDLLQRGGALALFPEGTSHSDPKLKPLKTGAARIALGSAALMSQPLQIVPAGLYYTRKTTFRSRALLRYGDPFDVPRVSLDANNEPDREEVRVLTERIGEALAGLTLQAEQAEALRLVERAESVFQGAGVEEASLAQRFELRRRFLDGYHRLLERAPERVAALESKVEDLLAECEALGISPKHLEPSNYHLYKVARYAGWNLALFFFLGPLGLLGALLHLPAYHAVDFAAHKTAKGEEDMLSTVKVLASVLFFPLTWIALSVGFGLWVGWVGALGALVVGPLSGWVALVLMERLGRAWPSARSLWAFVARRSAFDRLCQGQRAVRAEIVALGELLG
jgi:1-acyl-sn-glycerol-3-phosphate acyltransferase